MANKIGDIHKKDATLHRRSIRTMNMHQVSEFLNYCDGDDGIKKFVECGVCNNVMVFPHIGQCGHQFCRGCSLQFVESGHNECPVCNRKVEPLAPAPMLDKLIGRLFRPNGLHDFKIVVPANSSKPFRLVDDSKVSSRDILDIDTTCSITFSFHVRMDADDSFLFRGFEKNERASAARKNGEKCRPVGVNSDVFGDVVVHYQFWPTMPTKDDVAKWREIPLHW